MYSDIISLVRTTRDRDILLSEIESLKNSMYETKNGGFDAALKSEVRSEVAAILRTKKDSGQDMEKFVEGLATAAKALEELKLELAFDPTDETLETILHWVSQNVGEGYLLDIKVNPKILGGAKIAFKGKYFDGSLIKVVDATLTANQEEIIKMINTPLGSAQ